MVTHTQVSRNPTLLGLVLLSLLLLTGCPQLTTTSPEMVSTDSEAAAAAIVSEADTLKTLTAIELAENERLQVVASTNIVADVVAQVGGEQIDLVGLIPIGADPHSFEPAPQDLRTLNEADVIFLNGLQLEEPLMPLLVSLDSPIPVISVNIGVETLMFGESSHDHGTTNEIDHAAAEEHTETEGDVHSEDDHAEETEEEHDHHHDGADPHTWFSVHAVEQWVTNIEQVLSALDPANADTYAANAAAYRAELTALAAELDALVAEVPVERRKLITDHGSFGYFAADYGFTVIGTVIPSLSTVAAPAAGELAALQDQITDEGVPAIFVGTTVNADLAAQVAADTGIVVVPVYTGSLSDAVGPAATYLDFMRHNVATIVNALRK